jgi:hypothetical protein
LEWTCSFRNERHLWYCTQRHSAGGRFSSRPQCQVSDWSPAAAQRVGEARSELFVGMHQLRMKHAFALMQQLENSEWPVSGGYVRDSAWAADVYTKWPQPRVVAPSAGISALVSAPYSIVRLNDVLCAVCDAASEADGQSEPDDVAGGRGRPAGGAPPPLPPLPLLHLLLPVWRGRP